MDLSEDDLAREAFEVSVATSGGFGYGDALRLPIDVWQRVRERARELLEENGG